MGFLSNRETRGLKKYGIKDPKLQEAFKDMAKEYRENYFLHGNPTKNLKSILEMSPDPLLDSLAETHQIKGSLKREQLENLLYESIMQSVSREFLFLSDKDEAILRKIASGRKPSRKEVEEVAAIMDAFGWSFSFTDRVGRVFSVMPAEVAECYLKESNNPESQQKRRLFYEIRKAAVICANLYGIFEKSTLLQILKQCVLSPETLSEEMDDSELWKSVRRSMDAMLERSGFIWQDKEYYINEEFQTRTEYKNFVKRLQNRTYFLPSRKEAQTYLAGPVDRNKIEYKCLRSSIQSITRNRILTNDWLFEIEELVVKDGAGFREVLETMFHDGIACSTSPRINTTFEEDLQNWIHTVRKWKNRGFSDSELGKPLSETQSQEISAEKTKKIGRNAPCPCGSGKKYKHCCINKSSV